MVVKNDKKNFIAALYLHVEGQKFERVMMPIIQYSIRPLTKTSDIIFISQCDTFWRCTETIIRYSGKNLCKSGVTFFVN